jgi:hypothetical protein
MSEPAGPGVHHDGDVPDRFEPEGLGGALVVHAVDLLDLQEMIARPEASDLVLASRDGPVAHPREVGVRQAPVRLDVLGVLGPGVALRDRPLDPFRRHLR